MTAMEAVHHPSPGDAAILLSTGYVPGPQLRPVFNPLGEVQTREERSHIQIIARPNNEQEKI